MGLTRNTKRVGGFDIPTYRNVSIHSDAAFATEAGCIPSKSFIEFYNLNKYRFRFSPVADTDGNCIGVRILGDGVAEKKALKEALQFALCCLEGE